MAGTYAIACKDLADVFVKENPNIDAGRAQLLAMEIQMAVDDWLERQAEPCAACGQPIGKGDHSGCILF